MKARKLLRLNALKTLYFSFIYPYFTYCKHVWGSSACDTHLHPLVILQKRCVRIITRSKYMDHTDPLFAKLGLLKIDDINMYVISKFMYKWYHDDLPPIFQNMFIPVRDIHDHSTRQRDHLYCPKIRNNLGKTKCSYHAAYIWNKILRAGINPDSSEVVFCKSMKQYIKVGLLWISIFQDGSLSFTCKLMCCTYQNTCNSMWYSL